MLFVEQAGVHFSNRLTIYKTEGPSKTRLPDPAHTGHMSSRTNRNDVTVCTDAHSPLPASKWRQAQQEADAIRGLLEKTAMNIVQIGLRLRLVRSAIGRYHFQDWLRNEFQWSQSVASNYMRAAETFCGVDCLSNFQPSALYVLARRKVSSKALDDAIERARDGEVITKQRAEAIVQMHSREHRAACDRELAAVRAGIRRLLSKVRSLDRERLSSATGQMDELQELARELQILLSKTA